MFKMTLLGKACFINISLFFFTGEIRCRCNEPECVSSGTQICKSSNIKMCYVMKTFDEGTGTPRYTHGCMDALVKNEKYKNICDTDSGTNKPAENFVTYRHDPIVQCCNKDLCNYNIVIAVPTNRSLPKPGELLYNL